MSGSGKTGQIFLYGDRGETVEGFGDFDGNGYDDVVVRKATGERVVWYMGATGKLSNFLLTGPNLSSWKVQDVEDYNNDGFKDVLFTKTNSDIIIWF